ncbi:MAG: ribbon-helix-helix protein, CopG family [Actinomycetes bacterium]
MTLRLPREQADDLELIATVDGRPMSEEIREALEQHVARRREDPEFQERLARVLKNNNAALRRLSK